MNFTIQLREREAKQAEALQARLHLKDIALYECEAKGAGPPNAAVDPVPLTADLDSEVSHVNGSDIDFAVTLRVACEDELTFHIQTTFLVRYRFFDLAKPASKTELSAFSKSYPAIAAWPYIRETVQALASRMGFPTEMLPLLRVVVRA
jgi:preprotein translocase subunit SecB